MENAIIYLPHPSIRPLQAADTLKQYRAFAADLGRVHIRVAVEKEEDAEMFRGLTRKLQGKPADLVIVSSDDFLPTTKGWDDWLLRQFQDLAPLARIRVIFQP